MTGFVRVEREGACAWVTLDRPPLNLIVPEMVEGIRSTFEALRRDPGVRAAVITGAGRATTAGMQLQVLRELTPARAKAFIASLHEAIGLVHDAPFPTVCMVNGACLGAGFELAMACDLRTAAAEAVLGLPEIRVGIMPGWGLSQRLSRTIGVYRAKELSLKDLKGKKNVVLFFFPKAMTRGCTIESCGFRDQSEKFAPLDTVVIGISTDNLDAQQQFTTKEKLNFPLMADSGKSATQAFGVLSRANGVASRYTFVIDKEGIIRKVYLVKDTQNHPQEVLAYVKENLTEKPKEKP